MTIPLRRKGLSCLLRQHQGRVILRRGADEQVIRAVDLPPQVRRSALRLPDITLATLPCSPLFVGGPASDLQTTRHGETLTIDLAFR
ncbi:hypothetical protein [Deinococcus sonorensis]|uniref:Uncharacterized protein n=2 Tax=Deinococcus sonorensis TaxID=309891 RepID=A0AAU7UG26_9DEIO